MATIQIPAALRSASKLEGLRAIAGRTGAATTMNRLDQTMMISGLVLIPLGVIAVLLGWYGASKTPWTFEQIPYLISGGLLGVGMMITGSILYLASWVSRLAGQDREEAAKARVLLAAMEAELRTLPEAMASSNGGPKVATRATIVSTPTGSMYHRPDCTVVAGRDDVTKVTAKAAAAMKPCRMCEPDAP